MRLKFAVASATGRTRCGEFVDQKDERKPIARDQRPETSGGKMDSQSFPPSSFYLLTCITAAFTLSSNEFGLREFTAENVECPAREDFRSFDATPFSLRPFGRSG